MPVTNSVVTTMRELVDDMDTFLTATGTAGAAFTQDSAPSGAGSGNAAWNAASAVSDTGELFVQVEWATQSLLTIHQSTGFTGPIAPGSEAGDSNFPSELDLFGVSISSAEIWGFANGDAANEDERFAHFVIEFNRDGRFAHFGFGHLEKKGTWDGGAYKYGWTWSSLASAIQLPFATQHRLLLDSNHIDVGISQNLATVRARNLTGQPASGDYLAFTNATADPSQTDGNGNGIGRASGYSRVGPEQAALLGIRGNPNDALIPLISNEVGFRTGGGDADTSPIGRLRDVRICNIGNIQPRSLVTLGSDDWQFFPYASKLTSPGSTTMASRVGGVAYRIT